MKKLLTFILSLLMAFCTIFADISVFAEEAEGTEIPEIEEVTEQEEATEQEEVAETEEVIEEAVTEEIAEEEPVENEEIPMLAEAAEEPVVIEEETEEPVYELYDANNIIVRLYANGGYFDDDPTYTLIEGYHPIGEVFPGNFYPQHSNPHKIFMGWAKSANGTVIIEPDEMENFSSKSDISLYAIWKSAWIVKLDGNGGMVDMDGYENSTMTMYVFPGDACEPAFAYYPSGEYAFAGWSRTKNGSVNLNPDRLTSFKPTKDEVLYAVWKKGITLTVNANGGRFYDNSQTKKVCCEEGKAPVSMYLINPPTNKILLGYSSTKTDTKPQMTVEGIYHTTFSQNTTLYAIYGAPLSAPKLITTYNGAQGIGVNFKEVAGADYYVLYRKYKGVWSEIAKFFKNDSTLKKTNGGLMYTDTSVKTKYGEGYIYSVAAGVGDYVSPYDTKGLAAYRLINPKFTSVTAGSGKVTLKWNSVACQGYEVQYATEADAKAGKWTKMPQTTKTTLTVTGLKKGVKYVFRVRCQKTNKDRGTTWSEYSPWGSATVK